MAEVRRNAQRAQLGAPFISDTACAVPRRAFSGRGGRLCIDSSVAVARSAQFIQVPGWRVATKFVHGGGLDPGSERNRTWRKPVSVAP